MPFEDFFRAIFDALNRDDGEDDSQTDDSTYTSYNYEDWVTTTNSEELREFNNYGRGFTSPPIQNGQFFPSGVRFSESNFFPEKAWSTTLKRAYFNHTASITTGKIMPSEADAAMWLYDHIVNDYDDRTAREAYAGERTENAGNAGLAEFVVQQMYTNYVEHPVIEEDIGAAFESAAGTAPFRIRALLAAYILVNNYDEPVTREVIGDDIETEMLILANMEDAYRPSHEVAWPESDTVPDDRFSPDPAEEVGADSASIVNQLRIRGLSDDLEPEQLREITDVADFMWWLNKVDDLDEAIASHHFGRVDNPEVLRHAAPPDSWEEADPSSINEEICSRCGSMLYEVETVDDGLVWVNADGERGAERLGDPRGEVFRLSREGDIDDGYLCDSCYHDAFEGSTSIFVIFDGGERYEFNLGPGLLIQQDTDAPMSESSFASRAVRDYEEGVGNMFWVTPNPNVGDTAEQTEAVRQIVNHGGYTTDKRVAIRYYPDRDRVEIGFPNDDPEAAQAAKSIFENPEQVTA